MKPRALVTSPLGFLIGLSLGAVGGGGSILAVPVLVYAAGESVNVATTTSLLVVGITALGGITAHLRARRVRVVPGTLFGLAGVGGSVLGTRFNHSVDENILLLGFAGLMLIAASRMWVSRAVRGTDTAVAQPAAQPTDSEVVATMARPATARLVITPALVAKVLTTGTVVGLMTGFFGVGGGFIIVPALVLALGFEMAEAVGTSLLVIAINATVALVSRLGTDAGIDWAVAIPFTVSSVMGVSVGKKLADRVPATTLARWFVGLLVATAIYIAVRATGALVGGPS